jgi:hypothetical protein
MKEETTDGLCADAAGAPATFERTASTNKLKKMADAGYNMTDCMVCAEAI